MIRLCAISTVPHFFAPAQEEYRVCVEFLKVERKPQPLYFFCGNWQSLSRDEDGAMATKKKRLQGTNFIARNLQWLMAQEGITQQALAEATGVGQPTINRILSGRNLKPRDVTLHPLARHFDVPLDDLKTKDLSSHGTGLTTLRGVKIPMVSSKIAGKQPIGPDWPDRVAVYCEVSPEAIFMDVSDEGMEPVLHRGDHVIVEPEMLPQPGDFVAVRLEKAESAIVRKYRAVESGGGAKRPFELVPLNQDFATLSSRKTGMKWLGVCIELRRSLRKP